LTVDSITAEAFALQVERYYGSLISTKQRVPQVSILRPGMIAEDSNAKQNSEPSLGGKFLYAGELDAEARALVVAANIAGAATLATSADAEARKQAMRDGVVDFLVTTLDEALRILKNEVRKRETVAVCIAQAPEIVEHEMLERGVLPDLKHPIEPAGLEQGQCILSWRVVVAPALWLPKIDVIVADCLHKNLGAPGLDSETGESTRRWLRLAPRYLGRMAQGVRVLRCSENSARYLAEQLRAEVESGRVGAVVEINLIREGQSLQYFVKPPLG
jgi:urocanate hydratase